MSESNYPILESINSPDDLRCLPNDQLEALAEELRVFLVDSVSKTGGHLASNLGTVELTIALHHVYNTPEDKVVWDVGHQSYSHKILTGRRDAMDTLRKPGGLSGFPKRDESPFDAFGTGHSSTSISAALGMAVAAQKAKNGRKSVAVIGDGAMTAGMAFEALNHAGDLKADLLVILNDNEMSISPNVGALSNYLARILTGRLYSSVRESGKKVLQGIPSVLELAKRAEEHVKGMVVPGTLFEELGFNYIGPIDGHDLPTLINTMRNLRAFHGPQLLHVVTRKGKGYAPAEDDPRTFHGVGSFDPENGQSLSKGGGPTYTQVFGQWLCDMAAADNRLVGITPAMCEGSGLTAFSQRFPDRYFDVGIAEQHAVTFAGGMACGDTHPVVAIYSSFLQRAYDQLIHDVALQNLPVLFAIDRGGLVGADGATHDGIFDIATLQCVPNMVVMTPANEADCRAMLSTGFQYEGPAAVRYPRGTGPGVTPTTDLETLEIGKSALLRQGEKIALLAFGSPLSEALAAAEEINASVIDMRFVRPLDEEMVIKMAKSHTLLVTLEEGVIRGGAGSVVAECLTRNGLKPGLIHLGIPDRFLPHGNRDVLLDECRLSRNGILNAINAYNERYPA